MNYSPELKEAMLRRMLPPNNESITKISKEEGIATVILCPSAQPQIMLRLATLSSITAPQLTGNLAL